MINPKAPAYPRIDTTINEPGMDIRTKIAAMAMQGLLSRAQISTVIFNHEETANLAVKHADALIKELNKEG